MSSAPRPVESPDGVLARRHWVFDMDGTLTVAVHDFAAIREAVGIPKGQPILETLRSLPPEAAADKWQALEEIELELCDQASAAEGARELLERLMADGIGIGVLTRNSLRNAERTLEVAGLVRFFDDGLVVGRDEAEAKPSGAGIELLRKRWGTEPEDVVMIGDYVYDLLAGRNAGVATVHVDITRSWRWPEHADLCVASLTDLLPSDGKLRAHDAAASTPPSDV